VIVSRVGGDEGGPLTIVQYKRPTTNDDNVVVRHVVAMALLVTWHLESPSSW
jgi:hypothetical protein